MTKGILISSINRPPGYSIAKKIKQYDASIRVSGSTIVKPNWLIRQSRFFDSIEHLPLPILNGVGDRDSQEAEYINGLVDIMERNSLDVFLPTNDEEIYLASKHKRILQAKGIDIYANEWSVTEIAQDKFMMNQRAHAVNFPAPAAFRTSLRQVDPRIEALGFPLILKAERSTSSAGVRKVSNLAELNAAKVELSENYDSLLVEEYIQGDTEISINLVRSAGGKFRCCFGLKKFHYIHPSWSTSVQIIELDENVIAAAKRLADSIGLVGFAAIQTKVVAATGELKLVELNPRLGNNARILIRMIPELGRLSFDTSEAEIPVPYQAYGVSLLDDLLAFPLYLYHWMTFKSANDNNRPGLWSMVASYINIYRRLPTVDDVTIAVINDPLFSMGFVYHVLQLETLPSDWKKLIPWGAVR